MFRNHYTTIAAWIIVYISLWLSRDNLVSSKFSKNNCHTGFVSRILCVISMPVVSLSERIVLLFDGYRYARFNLFDFSRVVILRLLPIYLIGFSFSSSLSVNCDYFKLRLYRYSIWHNAINCAFASLIAIFIALQLLLASTLPFLSGQSSQEALFNVSPLVLILVIITVFMELFAATLCFFNCYLCTSNSVLSFILIFFIYLLFSLFPFPSPLFGTSLSGKIKASTLCTFFSFITTITETAITKMFVAKYVLFPSVISRMI